MSLPTPVHVYRRLNRVHDSLRQALTAVAGRDRTQPAQHLLRLPFNIG